MEDFLNKVQLPENAVKIYLNCIGELPLTKNEVKLMVPDLDENQFLGAFQELLNIGIIIPIYPKNTKLLTHYIAIAPFNPIDQYYKNIKKNVEDIKKQLTIIFEKSLSEIFEKNELIELNSVYKAAQELRKDIEEDTIIQKQDVEDIVRGMEILRELNDILGELHSKIKGITQTEFTNLIKHFTQIESEIKDKVEAKKGKRDLIESIESTFKDNFDKMVNEFTVKLHELIRKDFERGLESVNNVMNSTFQFRNDFKILLLNMINNFEIKMNSIIDIIKEKDEGLGDQKLEFKDLIIEELNKINEDSINSIISLNDPINKVIQDYLNKFNPSEKDQISQIYQVYSLQKVKSEITSFINSAQNELKIILPIIENFISIEEFKGVSKNLKIKLAASEAHTNSLVKNFKEIPYLEYRTLKNSSVIALQGDADHLIIGVIQANSNDKLKDFVGFTTDFPPLVKLLEPVITSLWQIGSSEVVQTPKSVGIEGNIKVISDHLKTKTTPTQGSQSESLKTDAETQKPKLEITEEKTILDIKQPTESPVKIQKKAPSAEIPIKEEILQVSLNTQPEQGDQNTIMINNAFISLIDKLSSLKGTEFSEELEKIANLILEKKGFSVTLHKVRSVINQYKLNENPLNELDIKQILASIEDWKNHIF